MYLNLDNPIMERKTKTVYKDGDKTIKLFIENNGGTVTGSVSKNTDAVIVGTDPGSKYDKALALNIKIINEEEIKQIMGK